MSEHNDQVFEAVVTHYDRTEKKKTIVWGPETFVARSERAAEFHAIRQVDKKYASNDLGVKVRPFK